MTDEQLPLPDPWKLPEIEPLDLEPVADARPATRPVPPPPTVPAGWYPDPDNHDGFRYGGAPSMRYFDGVEWTDNRAPMQRRQPHPQPAAQPIIINNAAAPQPTIINQQFAQTPLVVVHGGTNHGLHLVLSLLTCGAWLPVWLIIVIVNGGR